MLERQERFIHDASHELRTPLTIARGHLELPAPRDRRRAGARRRARGAGADRRDHRAPARAGHRRPAGLPAAPPRSSSSRSSRTCSCAGPRSLRARGGSGRWSPARCGGPRAPARGARRAARERRQVHAQTATRSSCARASTGPGSVVIEVEDEGCGVPAEALERIFDRFARVDAARTRSAGGVGLGLAIVDAIAKGHGGRCTVASTAKGSIFALHLPGFSAAGGAAARCRAGSAFPDAEPALIARASPRRSLPACITAPANTRRRRDDARADAGLEVMPHAIGDGVAAAVGLEPFQVEAEPLGARPTGADPRVVPGRRTGRRASPRSDPGARPPRRRRRPPMHAGGSSARGSVGTPGAGCGRPGASAEPRRTDTRSRRTRSAGARAPRPRTWSSS